MPFQVLSRYEQLAAFTLTITLGAILSVGFIPTSRSFARFLLGWFATPSPGVAATMAATFSVAAMVEMASFPILSAFFWWTLPKRKSTIPCVPLMPLFQISVLPLLIALGFGAIHPAPSILQSSFSPDMLWYSLFIPVGEECLFRGWFYQLVERLWPKFASATNPLPTSLWMSSIAFSLWHAQNLETDGLSFVLFQMVYTIFTGLWLGYLHWKTGKLLLPIIGHISINFLSSL